MTNPSSTLVLFTTINDKIDDDVKSVNHLKNDELHLYFACKQLSERENSIIPKTINIIITNPYIKKIVIAGMITGFSNYELKFIIDTHQPIDELYYSLSNPILKYEDVVGTCKIKLFSNVNIKYCSKTYVSHAANESVFLNENQPQPKSGWFGRWF